jgi:hypothetical protein
MRFLSSKLSSSLAIVAICSAMLRSSLAEDATFRFPPDKSVLDVKRDFGAKGDGVTDDTDALQKGLDASAGQGEIRSGKSSVLWIPNGTYRVTRSLIFKQALGPWFYGESRDGVVIKLDDNAQGVSAVLRTHPNEKGPTSADWFMRNLRHFTIDVGNNPDTDGIRYHATNSGTLADVRVLGNGKIGINSSFIDQSGPNLIRDVEIDGFETGILSQWIWGQTLSNITIRNCRKVGVSVSANVVAIENLSVIDTPLALENTFPNDWHHWGGVVALTGGRFTLTKAPKDQVGPAILNTSILYARDVRVVGYPEVIRSETPFTGLDPANPQQITTFRSHEVKKLFDEAGDKSLQLPIKPTPTVPWEADPSQWYCLDDAGAIPGDGIDDTDAIETGLRQAADAGKTHVYLRGVGGPDPNGFTISRRVSVPAPIRRFIGLGWARILSEAPESGFVVDDRSADIVHFQNIDAFGGPPIQICNRSQQKTIVVESCGVTVVGEGLGDIFISDCPANVELRKPGQNCWARQLNPEGTSDVGLVQNNGANLWCLGVKHEGRGVRFATKNGGKTEILGLFNYGGSPEEMDMRPSFVVDEAAFSVAALREIAFDSHTAYNKVSETYEGQSKTLDKQNEGGWIGWTLYRSRR